MRIKIQQFLFAKSISWANVGQEIGRSFLKQGHDVEFISTDGLVDKFIPKDLAPFIKHNPSGEYSMQFAYTAPQNWSQYFSHGKKNRLAVYAFEWEILPPSFPPYCKYVDYILAPSNFCRDIFIKNHISPDMVVTVPHGVNIEKFSNKEKKYKLKTNKKYKILVNIGQQHLRKAIHLAIEGYFKAFTNKDDVCLILKVSPNKEKHSFNVDAKQILNDYKKKYKNHPEVEYLEYVDDIVSLYNAVNILYTTSYTEGFYLPSLEAFANNNIISIAPRYSGQLDYMNDSNSLLIDGQMIRAKKEMQYWQPSVFNAVYESDTNDAARLLQKAVKEHDQLLEKFRPSMEETIKRFTWENVTKQIMSLTT